MTDTSHDEGLVDWDRRPAIPGNAPQSVAAILDLPLAERPNATALVAASGRLSYRELDEATNRATNALQRLGIGQGDRVGVSLPNDLDIVVLFLATMRLGAIWVGIPPALSAPEKAFIANDAGLSLLIRESEPTGFDAVEWVDPGLRCVQSRDWEHLVGAEDGRRPATRPDPFAPCAIAYTSGTTGVPKGVVHSQHNLLMPGAVAVASGEFSPDAPIATPAPLTILNLMVLVPLTAFQAGAPGVLIENSRPLTVAAWVARERIHHMTAVPTVYHDLLAAPEVSDEQLSTLVRPRSGGAAVTEALRSRWLARFGHRLTSSLALTEAPTYIVREAVDTPRIEGSLGKPVAHVDALIVDEHGARLPVGETGEICVAPIADGPWANTYTPMLGYWGRPEETREALRGGILHTGDMGRRDAEGNVYLIDRKSSLIIRAGSNIYPAEIERAIALDPRVTECVVAPKPDERLGERTVAFVQPKQGMELTSADVVAHCKAHLARYKVPDEVCVVADFPRTALGKVARKLLASGCGA